jgi:DNA-binding NtrC family response regulator
MAEDPSSTLARTDRRRPGEGAATPRPFLFLVFQCHQPLDAPACFPLADVDEVVIGRGAARSAERRDAGGVRLLDVRLVDGWASSTHARLTLADGRARLDDPGSTNGTFVNGVPRKATTLTDGDLIEIGHTFFLYRLLVASDEIVNALGKEGPAPGLSTFVPELCEQLGALRAIAASTISVVLQGESGTGKEVIARAVHTLSGRPGPFIAVNCGALPEALIESELFGHRKGAFSGATEDRPGLVRSADRGTLFLDEIGDLPAASQTAFLRVLQESEVVPVGSTRPVKVDLRVVAATHRDLPTLVDRGEFRGDLFARIAGFTVELPPLRRRREDLGLLIASLLRRLTPSPERAAAITFECTAARALLLREWRLNVRELEKCLGTALVLAGSGRVEIGHLPSPSPGARPGAPDAAPSSPRAGGKLDGENELRKGELIALFREHRGNISAVARAMGKGRTQIQRWIQRYCITPESYRE